MLQSFGYKNILERWVLAMHLCFVIILKFVIKWDRTYEKKMTFKNIKYRVIAGISISKIVFAKWFFWKNKIKQKKNPHPRNTLSLTTKQMTRWIRTSSWMASLWPARWPSASVSAFMCSSECCSSRNIEWVSACQEAQPRQPQSRY